MEVIGTSSGAADSVTAVDHNHDDVNIPPLREKYDVFISFRGEDTRLSFTSHLHAALERKKFETYIDYRLKKGDEIGRALLEAIEKSRLSVIIFSKNYASSTWCLKELVHILERRTKYGQMVLPIFYDTSPSDMRKPKQSYADAFAKHETCEDTKDKVNDWKDALVKAAGLSGFDYSNTKGTEADFIEEVVKDISTKLNRTSYDLKGMVGIETRIEQVESLLSTNDWQGVCTIGIWGMGGIGKTTLAKSVFNRLSSKFEACCFLSNVRETAEQTDGVNQLKKTLLRDILKEENLSIDMENVRERCGRTKVLIVFDDVSDWKQIKDLAGDNLRYGDGSRIMVTSRERRSVLKKAVSNEKYENYIYEVKKINTDDAFRLFESRAFNDNSPREEYAELSERVVKYAGGIPLALEILGSLFFECESKDEWEDAWRTLRNYPNKEIQNSFRVSYNRLVKHAQEVFLDIACFYKEWRKENVIKMVDFGQLDGPCAADGIRVLCDRSLISIDSEWETIDMHDLVQEMGRAIVHEQCTEEPGRRSRLFIAEDIYHVLKNNTGTEKVQAIIFPRWSWNRELKLDRADFKKMYNMRLLDVGFLKSETLNLKTLSLPNSLRYLGWGGYPFKSLPPEFYLENLVELHMPYSEVTQLWDGSQNPMNLKVIQLRDCKRLTALPNFSRSPNIEHIDLQGCESLVEIPQHFKNLDKLTHLNLSLCKSFENLPEMPGNIEFLNLEGSGIKILPSSVWSHEKISYLDINGCEKLEELPSNTCKLKVSGAFSLNRCTSLEKFWELPRGIGKLNLSHTRIKVLPTSSMECLLCLTKLKLRYCMNLASLPPSICKLKSLEELDLSRCSELEVVPSSIYELTNIKTLSFNYCRKLRNFPQPTGTVGFLSLEILNLRGSGILVIPEGVICSTSLRVLDLGNTKIRSIPSSIKQVSQLSRLCFFGCESLRSLPELPMVRRLDAYGCKSLRTVSSSRTAITRCWNRYELLQEKHTFFTLYDRPSLGYDARSNIMVDSQLRIMRVATASSKLKEEKEDFVCFSTASSNLKEEDEEYEEDEECEEEEGEEHCNCSYEEYYKKYSGQKYSGPFVTIVCPGDEIPNWFVHQNEGASINVRLPANWFREGFLGFALSFVAYGFYYPQVQFKCKYNFKTGEGESHEINCYFTIGIDSEGGWRLPLQHVFVLYKDLEYEERTKWSSAFYDRVTKVSVHFQECFVAEVEKCGMCLLYAEDAEKLKCDVMSQQEQDEHAACGSGELYLSSARIKVLPTSLMRCLFCLTILSLDGCSELKVVLSSIYKLTNIKTLSFSHCRKLRIFPQPTGSVGFLSLEVLNLDYSGILEIPEFVIYSTSLRALNLSGTKIRSIPSSIKQASQLSCLCLNNCNRLQSLPEVPMLGFLSANGCKSLKTVPSSRTAITQRWNRHEELLREQLNFSNCPRLGDDARSSIMADAQLRIMRVATVSSKLKEDYEKYSRASVTIVCPGDEIPNWFVHQNEGASINVRLPANWFREGFLGFALSFVASGFYYPHVQFECKYNFKTGEGEGYEICCKSTIYSTTEIDGDDDDYFDSHLPHVFVLYKDLEREEVFEYYKDLERNYYGLKWSSAFYDDVTEVSVHFEQEREQDEHAASGSGDPEAKDAKDEYAASGSGTVVQKCGLCLLYAKDAEKLKWDVMSRQEQDEHAASGSGDPEASGSNESEEASGSDDSEGESGSGGRKRKRESEEASGRDESEQASGSDEPDASRSD